MYIVSIGEIFLKGGNRSFFTKRLISNIAAACKIERKYIEFKNQRIIIKTDLDPCLLGRVFGPTFFAPVKKSSFDQLSETVLSLVDDEKSFRISTRRHVKVLKSSQKLNEELGGVVLEKFPQMKVQMKGADLDIRIEIFKDYALLYKKVVKSLGGLPVGVSGNVFLRVDDEKRSTLTAFLLMKRGIIPVLSKPLPLLDKFQLGFTVLVRDEEANDDIATDEVLDSATLKQEEKFILRPLIAFSEKEINDLYKKIVEL